MWTGYFVLTTYLFLNRSTIFNFTLTPDPIAFFPLAGYSNMLNSNIKKYLFTIQDLTPISVQRPYSYNLFSRG
jgi:hypothetical protein